MLPDPDKRNAYSHFFEAVRSRIIDDIVAVSMNSSNSRQVKRFKNGFLMSQPAPTSDLEYKVVTRYLPILFLEIYLIIIKAFDFLSTTSPFFLLINRHAFPPRNPPYVVANIISGHIFTSPPWHSHHTTSLWHSCFLSFLLCRPYYSPYQAVSLVPARNGCRRMGKSEQYCQHGLPSLTSEPHFYYLLD